jgi:tetratricopeptide (TPR) repeat protein
VAELPQGYQAIPEAEQKRASAIFERAQAVAGGGQYDYSIELYLNGLDVDPENVDGHKALRSISLRRKAGGGKDLGFIEKMKVKRAAKDDKQIVLTGERLLAYDPGNTDVMLSLMQSAFKAGFYDTVLWIADVLMRANSDSPKPDFNKYIALKDTYHALERFKEAADAAQLAAQLRPENMDLAGEMKNLAAEYTMRKGRYDSSRSFRESVRDMQKQQDLLEAERGVTSNDMLLRAVQQAQVEYEADPNEPGKLLRLADALVKTEQADYENRAIELLRNAYEQTRQFRFRFRLGQVRLGQLTREERGLLSQIRANPADESLKQRYQQFIRGKYEEELQEYTLAAENYPTNMEFRFAQAQRLYLLGRFNEAIPLFQQARQDPKLRVDSSTYLGRAFLDAGFVDEASNTLREGIEGYELRGDPRSKEMYYWYGRALEQKGDLQAAMRSYSQVAQWDFQYRDVQSRIRQSRGTGPAATA